MENASKALIIAAAVLITILVISLGVYVFNYYSQKVETQSNLDEQEISAFNNQILDYLGDKVSGSQVNALIQTVRSINQTAKTDNTTKYISITSSGLKDSDDNSYSVELDGSSNSFASTSSTRVLTGSKTYKVEATYGNAGYIEKITITQN